MPWWSWLLPSLSVLAVVGACFVCWLVVVVGRRDDARALATFIADCIVLLTRLARDRHVPRRRKLLLLGLVGCRSTSSPTSSRSPANSTTQSSSRSSCATSSAPAASP